jgi:hypothetical protein
VGNYKKHYTKPAGRKGSYQSLGRARPFAEGEIWSDAQRSAYRGIAATFVLIDKLDEQRDELLAQLGVQFEALRVAGMTRGRIGAMFGMSASKVDSLIEHGYAAVARHEMEGVTSEQRQG